MRTPCIRAVFDRFLDRKARVLTHKGILIETLKSVNKKIMSDFRHVYRSDGIADFHVWRNKNFDG
jgi:hypothetical protein